MKNTINWKTFGILMALGLVSVACVFPYVVTIQGELLAKIGQPLWLIFVAQFLQTAVLFAVAIYFGLVFCKKTGFRLPLIEAILAKGDYRRVFKDIMLKSVLLGAATATVIYVTDLIFTGLGATVTTHQDLAPIWQKLLAAVYGGSTEEILMRLFLMSFFVWLGMKLFRQDSPAQANIIVSIILAAIIFGLGHLPITASLAKIDTLIVSRAIILNGIGGIVFGWLFWKKGLESAMIAHFTADIFLLTLLPLLFR